MKSSFRLYSCGLLLALSFLVSAQQYPVRINAFLLPPYTMRLSDYATTGETRLQLQLLMTDLMEPSHRVRLSFSLESGTSYTPIASSSPHVAGLKEISLLPGQPITLSNVDIRPLFELQNLTGISAQSYSQPLPQGFYRFCFQVFDVITGRPLSSRAYATAYLQQYDPPILTLPQQGEKITHRNEFQQILFQWQPRQLAPNTRYVFTLRELWDTERPPVEGFLTSRTLYQEELYPNTLFYGPDKPSLLPGKRYAWQVKAISARPSLPNMSAPTDNDGIYQNNGLTEIFYFDYVENCIAPLMLTAQNTGKGKVEVRWMLPGSKPSAMYNVQYRIAKNGGQWTNRESYTENLLLSGLKDQTEYEYRVGAVCGTAPVYSTAETPEKAYTFSLIQHFTTNAKEAAANPNFQCGVLPQIQLTNRAPLQSPLARNEVFTAGDFPVTVIEAEGTSGTYSGKGYIVVPYLADTKLAVIFRSIQLNTDRQLISGVVETTYDVKEKAVMFTSEGIGETFGDKGIKNLQRDYAISEITYSATPPPGRITIKSDTENTSEEASQEELPAGKDYQITDKNGYVWNVDEKGTITKIGKTSNTGITNASNTDGVSDSSGSVAVTAYSAQGIKLVWDASASTYAYDEYSNQKGIDKLKQYYPAVKDASGKDICIPYKAILNGKTDLLTAKVSLTDQSLKKNKIIFKALKSGVEIPTTIQETETERTYKLHLRGAFDYAEEDILAVLLPINSTDKQKIIGGFKLVHLAAGNIDITLVPLDNNSVKRLDDIETQLKNTYSPVGITLNVKKEPLLDISNIVNSGVIDSEDSELMSTYSPQQQQINALYKGTDARYVLFITEKKSSTGQEGYMPLDGQFGYVYGNASAKTAPHELGHGVFKLKHPWKEYNTVERSTNLLMDYSQGSQLTHLDWKQINDPKLKLYAFQKQTDGEYDTYVHFGLTPSGNIIDNFIQNGKSIIVTALITNGNIFTVDKIKFKNNVYEWNKDKKAYVSTLEQPITVSKKSSKNLNRVNLFKSRGDNCLYDYLVIDWNTEDEKPENIGSRIAAKITATQNDGGNWNTCPLDIQNASCSDRFTEDVLDRDRKDCSKEEHEADLRKLKQHLVETNADNLVKLLNSSCLSAIRNLSFSEIAAFFNVVATQETLREDSELAVLRLMTAIREENYTNFYELLESDGNRLLKNLVAKMNDAYIAFWTGNNYTNFIGALVTMFNKAPASIANKWPKEQNKYFSRVVNLKPILYESEVNEFKVSYSNKKNTGIYDSNTGKIIINEVYTIASATLGERVNDATFKQEEKTVLLDELSPLEPIVLVLDSKPLPLIQTALDGLAPLGKNTYIVPAIFLKYNQVKVRNNNIEKTIYTTLDLATIALSGGTALAAKATWVRRAWAMAEVAGAVGNIAVSTRSVSPEMQKAVDAYNLAMGIIGVKNVAQGGYKFVANLPENTKDLLLENKGIRDLLVAQYTQWKTLTTNLDNLSPAERQLITEQEQVWKVLLQTLPEGTYLYNPNMANKIRQVVLNSGESMEKFVNINYKAANGLASADEISWLQNFVTKYFPKPKDGDVMRKVISIEIMNNYQLGKTNPNLLRDGFITKAEDYLIPKNSEELIENLRLDYNNTPFSKDKGFAIIEFDSDTKFSIDHAFNTSQDNNPLPYTKTGMTGSKRNIIPEYVNQKEITFKGGETITLYDKNGNIVKKYNYKIDDNTEIGKWE